MSNDAVENRDVKADGEATPLNPHQEALKELYKLEPDQCLLRIVQKLRALLNCEAVSILLWDERRQKLQTRYVSGLPGVLDAPEEYSSGEGLTGEIIFSDGKWVRCIIDIEAQSVMDAQTQRSIEVGQTNWNNMQAYARGSSFGQLRSMLGAPFYVKGQKIGAVKLINKIDQHGGLDRRGFSVEDVEALAYFHNAIEHVIEVKRNEEQVHSLLLIGQKIISQTSTGAVSDFGEILSEIAANCAETLNYRVCLIRLYDDNGLRIRASSIFFSERDEPNARHSPVLSAIEHKTPLMCAHISEYDSPHLRLETVQGKKKISLNKTDRKFLRFLRQHRLRSFLVIPIIQWGNVLGTIECYTSLPREFSSQELNAIQAYIFPLVITAINNRQHSLLSSLIELQRIGAVSGDEGGEERAINGVLTHARALLGRRLKMLSAVFSTERLTGTQLHCKTLYGAGERELKSILDARDYEEVFGQPGNSRKRRDAKVSRGGVRQGREKLDIIKAPILLDSESAPLGVLLLGVQQFRRGDNFPEQVAQISASHLGVTLSNIEEFRRSKRLLKIIDEASHMESLNEIYDFILRQTTDFFGFDFGAISRVDYIGRRVETVKSRSAKPEFVDPSGWIHLASYGWDEDDILTHVLRSKSWVIIDAAEQGEPRDPLLNEELYARFNHQNLARIWVPFIFRRGAGASEPDGLVLGVIEAGYHRTTQARINRQKSDLFVLFVDSCAKFLQRVMLLEERRAVDKFWDRFNREMQSQTGAREPERILHKLLEESVNLVRGGWGRIALFTHDDDKINFKRDAMAYKMPSLEPGRPACRLEAGAGGGVVGYAAATGKPYWSGDVGKEPGFAGEFDDVRSELAVPLRFSGQIVGVLDIFSNERDWFDERKAGLVQTVADQATVLFQNAKAVYQLYKLIGPFNPFAGTEEIHSKVINLVEDFLHTDAVSIWHKRPDGGAFRLELVAASEGLWKQYKESGITMLPADSFTGRAAAEGTQVQVSQTAIETQFLTRDFAEENRLRSMTAIPMNVGEEVYGVIDVFSRRDTGLFDEEVMILQILASKAAIALQSAALMQSFNEISRISPDDDLNSILRRVVQNVLARLHADPVILYRYNSESKEFAREPVVAGEFYDPVPGLTGENEFADLLLSRRGSYYLMTEAEYLEFEREAGRGRRGTRYGGGFWYREKIRSLAALRLEHGNEIVGVMFMNFRESKLFSESDRRLIEIFAAQAAAVIYNAKISEQNKRFWETQRADSLSLSLSQISAGLAHDAGSLLALINMHFAGLDIYLSRSKGKPLDLRRIEKYIHDLRSPLDDLTENFQRLKDLRRLTQFHEERCRLDELIRQALVMLRPMFERQRITVRERYGSTPLIICDKSQIQHLFINLFLNALDAMGTRGTLSVETDLDEKGDFVRIKIKDTGRGIPHELRPKIFEPFFTTKSYTEGSGMGLSVSRYIITEHGGSIDFVSALGKGTTFSIFLPITR